MKPSPNKPITHQGPEKVKVKILCQKCNEKFIFKGVKTGNMIDTGFKRCLCGNETDFDIEILQEY